MPISVNREALFEKVKALPPNIVVVEGWWDGDSGGWYVCLSAFERLAEDSYKEHDLTCIGHGQGEAYDFFRSLAGETPPYPEGLLAREVGQEVADQLGVPFYFPSPEKPVLDQVPRWIDWQVGRVSSLPIRLIDAQRIIREFASSDVAVVEAYWDYYHVFHPALNVITIENGHSDPVQYKSHSIGGLYWDDADMGRIVHGLSIPPRTPVEEALRLGQLLADALHTRFYFESPDNPHWHIPRWIDQQNSRPDQSDE